MPKLLKIDVSPRGDYSVSRKLGQTFADAWQQKHPGSTIVQRDLVTTDLPFVDTPWIMAAYSTPDQHTPEQQAAIKVSDALIAELLATEEILLATPMYNFSIPARLKAYIDHIVRINKTFTSSYEGLVKGKKLTILIASGGVYTPGARAEPYNVESSYLKQIFGFIGVTDVTIHLVGGTAAIDMGQVKREDFLSPFEKEVAAAAAAS